ncbi:NAD(P)-dependent alcohol dehydrogenase [Amycolatopsis japonica]
MSVSVTAAVARGNAEDFSLERLALESPRHDEVLVRFTASGLCATDLDAAAGRLPTPRPAVLGHEGVGVIEAVGSAVTGLRVGTTVVCGVDSCGVCRNCRRGQPAYCTHHLALNFAARRRDGTVGLRDDDGVLVHDHFFGQSSFAGHGLAHRNGLVPVDGELPASVLAPLGCGVVTGAGAVWNSLKVTPGSTIAVFGAGSVGLSAIIAANVAGAGRIIAVDLHRARLDLAVELGATDTVLASSVEPDLAIGHLTKGDGADFCVESTGDTGAMNTAIRVLGALGKAAILGVAGVTATLSANAFKLLRGQSVVGSVMGHQAPAELIPRILALYERGRFPIERLTRTYPLRAINKAASDSRTGTTVKAVLLHDH